jgi:hypothetical protein
MVAEAPTAAIEAGAAAREVGLSELGGAVLKALPSTMALPAAA